MNIQNLISIPLTYNVKIELMEIIDYIIYMALVKHKSVYKGRILVVMYNKKMKFPIWGFFYGLNPNWRQ